MFQLIADYIFGAGSLECHRDRQRRLQRESQQNKMDVDSDEDESVEDGSALFDNTSDNGNDFVGRDESDTEEDSECGNLTESNESSSSRTSNVQRRTRARSMECALGQLSLQEGSTSSPPRTSIALRTRSRSVGNGEESMASPRETRSLSRGCTRDIASTSSPVSWNTRSRSRSRGRTENKGGSSASTSSPVSRNTRSRSRSRGPTRDNASSSTLATPVAARSKRSNSRSRQKISSPLLSPIPIEKESKRVQEGGDTTLDTVDLTDVCDDTVHYEEEEEEEVSSPTSPSDAMIYDPSDKYDSVCPDSLEAILESLDVTIEELRLKYPLLYHVLTTFDSKEIGPAIEQARDANAQNAQGLSDAAAVEEEEDEASVDEEENDFRVGNVVHVDEFDNLPQDRAVLGLSSHHSKAMDENPETEGHAVFMETIKAYSERFQGAKPNSNYTRNDVVEVSIYYIHSQFDSNLTALLIH